MLFGKGFMPIITKATRITNHTSTLIDHIYTHVPQKILKSGICVADITDHLPIFCTVVEKVSILKHDILGTLLTLRRICFLRT